MEGSQTCQTKRERARQRVGEGAGMREEREGEKEKGEGGEKRGLEREGGGEEGDRQRGVREQEQASEIEEYSHINAVVSTCRYNTM